jgi:predicted type IV restriction endonuclease
MGLPGWREDLTRYGIIDPTIRALGWDTADPKECHPEYPRSENGDRVDYAFFTRLDLAKLEEEDMPAHDIIVEAKALVLNQTWS